MIEMKKDFTSGSVPRFPAKPKLASSFRTFGLPKTSLFFALFCSAMAHAQKGPYRGEGFHWQWEQYSKGVGRPYRQGCCQ